MAVNLSPVGGVAAQFFTNTGAVLTGGKLYTYAAGTTTPAATYTSSNGATAWTNPVVLDAAGRVPSGGEIWLTDGIIYKFVLKDSNDVLIATYDNITGINSNAVAYTNQQEIITATAGQTVFPLTISYAPATNSLSVFVDGVNQYGPGAQYSYVETDSNTVTFNAGLHVGAEVKFTTTQQQGAGAVDASQVSYDPPFTGSVVTNVEAKLAQTISVKDFGAVGDFDPSTGVGTDDRIAIQAALDYAASIGNCKVTFPAGRYYLGTGYSESSGGGLNAQIYLGSAITTNAANYVDVEGYGAAIYQGAAGQAFYVGNANHCSVRGLSIIGYAGGTLSPSREFDTVFQIGQNSTFIDVRDCYFTNSLGYTVNVTANPNVAGGGTTYTCQNISFINNTFKMRYGDGTPSYLSGSKSLWAICVIDIQSFTFKDNIVYGVLDLEPNLNGQRLIDVDVSNNQFLSGFVTPVVPAGVSTYWADEEIGTADSGGTIIEQSVAVQGATGAPVIRNINIRSNSFDYGTIFMYNVYVANVVENNFYLGKITVGATTGGDVNRRYNVSNNTAYQVTDATSGFIVFGGSVSDSQFHNNCVVNQDIPVISWDGAGGADVGGNSYVGNSSLICATDPAINFPTPLAATSSQLGTKTVYKEIEEFTTSLTDGTNSATLSVDTLFYRIEGRQLTFTGRLYITSAGSIGSDSYITLPAPANATGNMRYVVNVTTEQNFSPSANFTGLFGVIQENTDKCFIRQMRSTGSPVGVAAANFNANSTLIVSGTYFLD